MYNILYIQFCKVFGSVAQSCPKYPWTLIHIYLPLPPSFKNLVLSYCAGSSYISQKQVKAGKLSCVPPDVAHCLDYCHNYPQAARMLLMSKSDLYNFDKRIFHKMSKHTKVETLKFSEISSFQTANISNPDVLHSLQQTYIHSYYNIMMFMNV